jgi:DNA-binding response OmpR family regulator
MRLLLVEDNEELSKLLVKSLGASGFDADAVTTAADALSVLGSTHYAAVILDLGLPDCRTPTARPCFALCGRARTPCPS